jgi:hypothetical protein
MITLQLPVIPDILGTTAGVKRLTTVVSGWDNADTGRIPRFLGALSGVRQQQSFGRV